MGKKSWLIYPSQKEKNSSCGVIEDTRCRLSRGIGCTCGKWNASKIFSKEEKKIAQSYDTAKAIEEAKIQRKNAGII